MALMKSGRNDEAIAQLQKIAELQPDSANAWNNLGWILRESGRVDDSINPFLKAVELRPNYSEVRYNLGKTLLLKGQAPQAIAEYRAALNLQPDDVMTLSALAWIMATWPDAPVRNGREAIDLAQRASDLSRGTDLSALRALAAGRAEVGKFSESISIAERALKLAADQSNKPMADSLQADLKLYQQNAPVRDHRPLGR